MDAAASPLEHPKHHVISVPFNIRRLVYAKTAIIFFITSGVLTNIALDTSPNQKKLKPNILPLPELLTLRKPCRAWPSPSNPVSF